MKKFRDERSTPPWRKPNGLKKIVYGGVDRSSVNLFIESKDYTNIKKWRENNNFLFSPDLHVQVATNAQHAEARCMADFLAF